MCMVWRDRKMFCEIALKLAEPQYGIQSKILIKEVENEFGATEDWLKRSLNFTSVSENVSNEIQVLSSFSLMSSVVAPFDQE